MTKVWILTATGARDFRICEGLVATKAPQYIVLGEVPASMRGRAQQVTEAQLARLQERIKAKAPIEAQEISEDLARLLASKGTEGLLRGAEEEVVRLRTQLKERTQERDNARRERDAARDQARGHEEATRNTQAEVERLRGRVQELEAEQHALNGELNQADARIAELEAELGRARAGAAESAPEGEPRPAESKPAKRNKG